MRNAAIHTHGLEAALDRPFGWSFDSTRVRGGCIVEIGTAARAPAGVRSLRAPVLPGGVTQPLEHARGWVESLAGPGLGIAINRDTLARFAIAA